MNAKDYYNRYIRNRKVSNDKRQIDWVNIEFVHAIMGSEDARKGFEEFLPTVQNQDFPYSTDAFLNNLMSKIVARVGGDLADKISKMYVVKMIDYRGNAIARRRSVEYDGNIIEYWVGLTTLLQVASIIFNDYQRLQHYLFENHTGRGSWSEDAIREASEQATHNVDAFHAWTESWARTNRLAFDKSSGFRFREASQYAYLSLTQLCVIFVLAHEIGHHILLHSGHDAQCWIVSSAGSGDGTLTSRQRQEIDADLFAVDVLSFFNSPTEDVHWHRLSAPYLCLFALSVLSPPRSRTRSHPSMRDRFLAVRTMCNERYREDDTHAVLIKNIMHNFMKSMFKTVNNPAGDEWWVESAN